MADDTVSVLSADHYPYGIIENGVDYYNELTGLNDSESDISRYKNTLIMWGGDGAETVVVDTPCSSIDIVHPLLDFFAVEYVSRLYSGRDIFATKYVANQPSTCMPLVVLPNTGGKGTRLYLVGGVLLFASAAVLLCSSKKRRKEPHGSP